VTPDTPEDMRLMLGALGLKTPEDLFQSVPASLRLKKPLSLPPGLSELEVLELLRELASSNRAAGLVCFAGGGAYDHFVPAVVKALASRGEFLTSYTPYQPEVSQGVLQALFEYQTMVASLTGMEVSNASLYDGASALAEACLMALRLTGRQKVVLSRTLNPLWRRVVRTYLRGTGVEVAEMGYHPGRLSTVPERELIRRSGAVVVQDPNFFGVPEDLSALSRLCREEGALLVAASDPLALGALAPPGERGADLVAGEGQSLGLGLHFGGPYLGYLACRREHLRQLPGRLVGETRDVRGRRGFVLTLQTREQHIRRERATSNVCTNASLSAVAAAVYLSWLGPRGLGRLSSYLFSAPRRLAALLEKAGGGVLWAGCHFREFPLRTPLPARELILRLAERGYLLGPSLEEDYPELGPGTLLCAVTECRSPQEMEGLARALEEVLQ